VDIGVLSVMGWMVGVVIRTVGVFDRLLSLAGRLFGDASAEPRLSSAG